MAMITRRLSTFARPAFALGVLGFGLIAFSPLGWSQDDGPDRPAPPPAADPDDPLDDLPPPPNARRQEPPTRIEPPAVSGADVPPPGPGLDEPIEMPPPRPEVITAEPSPDHVWISGHWERDPDTWTWIKGEWIKPPLLPVRWVPGHWRHELGQFRWAKGHWATSDGPGLVVMKPVPAPEAIEETVPAAPDAGSVWVPGEWSWNGGWAWVPGYYTVRPTPLSKWVPGHWQVGLLGKWKWTPAHWSLL